MIFFELRSKTVSLDAWNVFFPCMRWQWTSVWWVNAMNAGAAPNRSSVLRATVQCDCSCYCYGIEVLQPVVYRMLTQRQRYGYGSSLSHTLQCTDVGDRRTVATPCYSDMDGIVILLDSMIPIAARRERHQTCDKGDSAYNTCIYLHFFSLFLNLTEWHLNRNNILRVNSYLNAKLQIID